MARSYEPKFPLEGNRGKGNLRRIAINEDNMDYITNPVEHLGIPNQIWHQMPAAQKNAFSRHWQRLMSYQSVTFVTYSESQTLYLEAVTHEEEQGAAIGERYCIALASNGYLSTGRIN